MRNGRLAFAVTILVGALAVPFFAAGQPAGQRRVHVDGAPVPAPNFDDGGDIDFGATGNNITGAVKSTYKPSKVNLGSNGVIAATGGDGTLAIATVANLPPCSNGQIYQTDAGVVQCFETPGSADAVGDPNTVYVCWDGSDSTGTGDISAPFKTIQKGINFVTEQGDPSIYTIALCAGTFCDDGAGSGCSAFPGGDSQDYPLKPYNTDSTSAQYKKNAHGLKIRGAGLRLTTISSQLGGGTVYDASGAKNVVITDAAVQGFPIVMKSDGGMRNTRFVSVDWSNVGSPMIRIRGAANQTNGFDFNSFFTLATGVGGQVIWENGASFAGNDGMCESSAWGGALACVTNADCGGICSSAAGEATKVGKWCTTDADCGAGSPAGTCDFAADFTYGGGPECETSSLDFMFYNQFMQSSSPFAELLPHTCDGGLTTPAATTVAIDHDATCSTGTCGAGGVSGVACATNADCQRSVKGTGTSFGTHVKEGEQVVIGSKRATVGEIYSTTFLRVTKPWTDSTGTTYQVSKDGWPCNVNADCGTSGTCREGTGVTFEEHFENAIILSGGETGYCGDGSGGLYWPLEGCFESNDGGDDLEHYCQWFKHGSDGNGACASNADCDHTTGGGGGPELFSQCNMKTGKCRSSTVQCDPDDIPACALSALGCTNYCNGGTNNGLYCTGDGDCPGGSCISGCNCTDECGADGCTTYGLYVEGTNLLRMRNATLTSTNIVTVSDLYDRPDSQTRAVDGAKIEMQGGSIEVKPTNTPKQEVVEVNGGLVSGKGIIPGKAGLFEKDIYVGDGTDTGNFCLGFDDDLASDREFCWNNTGEQWTVDSNAAGSMAFKESGTLRGTLLWTNYLGVPLVSWSFPSTMVYRWLGDGSEELGRVDNGSNFAAFMELYEGVYPNYKRVQTTLSECAWLENPVASDDWPDIWRAPATIKLTKIACKRRGGTGNIVMNLQRDDGTPADIASSDLNCATTDTSTGTLADAEDDMTAGQTLNIDIVSVSGTPTSLMICWEYYQP